MARALGEAELDQPLEGLTEQALQWLVDLHDGEDDEARWEAYLAWCERSAAHRRAAQAAEGLWDGLGGSLRRRRARRRSGPLLGVLLALGLATGGGWQAERHGWLADQRTGLGEHRQVRLADGSLLELAPETRVDIDLSGARRVLRLYSGELFVQVAPDPAHPFDVEAGGGRLRALGTAFDVRKEAERVRLVVTEHRVGVHLANTDASEDVQVEEGHSVVFEAGHLYGVQAVDSDAATAWRRNRLVFDGQPLGQVLDALGAYRQGLVWIRDERLRQMPVTGTLATDDPDAQLQWLERVLPVRIRQWPWLTLVEPDPMRWR